LFSRFYTHITEQNYFAANDTLLVAVSGGIDSMVLLHLLQKHNFEFAVAHFDHLTRQGQSSQDLQFVKDYCNKHQIEFHSKCMNNSMNYKNFHDEAHKQRYSFFNSLGYTKIVTGHHKGDVTESIFLNFLNGKSVYGISDKNQNIVRPLIIFSKNEIEEYAIKNKISFAEDVSNNESVYDRNYIRNKILPRVYENFDNFDSKIANLSTRISNRDIAFLALSEKVLAPKENDNYTSISKALIVNLDNLAYQVLHQYIMKFGFNLTHSKDIISTIDKPGGIFNSQDYNIIIDRDEIRIYKKSVRSENIEIFIQNEALSVDYNGNCFLIQKVEDINSTSKRNEAFLDLKKVGQTLRIRNWKEGDSFYPLNMGGKRQSLKKYFANEKLDRIEKRNVPVLTTSKNEIIWIGGYRVDDRFKITNETKSILKISLLSK